MKVFIYILHKRLVSEHFFWLMRILSLLGFYSFSCWFEGGSCFSQRICR